jgi:hypothetical protein
MKLSTYWNTLLTHEEFNKRLPKLHEVRSLNGRDQDGNQIHLDKGVMIPVHSFPAGDFYTVPTLKSESYASTAHDYVTQNIAQVLEGKALDFRVTPPYYVRNTGVLHTDFVLKEPYKMNEELFEKEWGIKYDDGTDGGGVYLPVVRVVNSFFGASTVEMALLRLVCTNGMRVMSEKMDKQLFLRLTHIGEVIKEFEEQVEQFMANLFDDHVVENMIKTLSSEEIDVKVFVEWLVMQFSAKAAEEVVDQFKMNNLDIEQGLNKWIALNIGTWAITHLIESRNRRAKLERSLYTTIGG